MTEGLLAAVALAIAPAAFAQTVQPGGTVDDQFRQSDLPTSQAEPPVRIERPRQGQPLAGTAFAVRSIDVQGASSIDSREIESLVTPFEGRTVTLADLAALADSITALYARRGYALSFAFVPEQTLADGIVRLRVVEGVIDGISVEFSDHRLPVGRARLEAAVRHRLQPLVGSGPVRSADLERAILTVNDWAGVDVSAVVRPSPSNEGAATLVAIVRTDAIDAVIGADNRLRAAFGREEVFASIAVNSLLTVGDRIELSSRRALADDAFAYAAIAYDSNLGHSDLRASAFYSRAVTEANGGLLGLLDFTGVEDFYRVGLRYPLLRSRVRSLYLSGDVAAIDTRSRLFGILNTRDRVRTLAVALSYDWADATGATSLVSTRLTQGIAGLGATPAGNPLRSRATASPDAAFIGYRYYRDQPLVANFRVRTDADVQFVLSGRSLLAANECTFGGPALGRGYDAGAISGDECWRGSVELARPSRAGPHIAEPYVFIDGGSARQTGPLVAGEPRRTEASSYGFGARLFTRFGMNADLQWSHTARRLFAGDRRASRLFFNISFQR